LKTARETNEVLCWSKRHRPNIVTLWNYVEQSIEFEISLYINFIYIDFEKVFDSISREVL